MGNTSPEQFGERNSNEAFQGKAAVRCALIDFAHCFFGEFGPDENFASGAAAFRDHAARIWGQEPMRSSLCHLLSNCNQ
jgi:hypothetical protein